MIMKNWFFQIVTVEDARLFERDGDLVAWQQ